MRPSRHATDPVPPTLGPTLATLALFTTGVWGRPDGEGWAVAYDLVYHVPLHVALIGLIRARVVRFRASMWLDGIVGALGAGAVAVSLLLGPALEVTEGHVAAAFTDLAHPVADVVLLALLVGVSAMLGVRRERTLLLVGAAIAANLAGDIVYLDLDLATAGVYGEGGPLDLAWLAAMALLALAASGSDPDTVRASSQASAQFAHHGGAADGARRGRPAAGPPPAAGGLGAVAGGTGRGTAPVTSGRSPG